MTQHKKGQRHRRRPGSRGPRPAKAGPKREHIEELHPTDAPPGIESFDEWDLDPEVQRAIRNMDIFKPTPIQALAIGPVLEGRDVIAKAETGTGKTLAFGAPMVSRIDAARSTVLGLILCPTRELASQVCDVIAALALTKGIRTALVVGGDPIHPQIADLQKGAQIVVGTPGRVLDLYQQRFLSFPWTEVCVLDEADKMFEIGFLDDIKKILSFCPEERQTLLFSATFPTEVLKLARSETTNPVEVATQRGTSTVSAIDQNYIEVAEEDRPLLLTRLIENSDPKDVFLVFCDRRTDVDRLLRRMDRQPFEVKALHGGYDQPSRYRVMSAFRTGEVKLLIATDVASRGLDVEHVTHVVNYNVPREVEDYTHRIGRTGRAGRSGTAITFVVGQDARRWSSLLNKTKFEIHEMEQPGRTRRGGRGREDDDRGGSRRPRRSERPAERERTEPVDRTEPVERTDEPRRPRRDDAERDGRRRRGGRRDEADEPRRRDAARAEEAPRARSDEPVAPRADDRTEDRPGARAPGRQRRGRGSEGEERPPRSRRDAVERANEAAPRAGERRTRPSEERTNEERTGNGDRKPFGALPDEAAPKEKPRRSERSKSPDDGRDAGEARKTPPPQPPQTPSGSGFGAGL